MKKNTYLFARLFIKLAILLAIIAVLGGIGFAVNAFQSMQRDLESVKYTPSPDLGSAASDLEKSYLGTNRRILRSLDIDNFPSTIEVVNFTKQIAEIQSSNAQDQAKNYLNLATTSLDSINQIKRYHISEFVKALQGLQQTLNDHAAKLRAEYASTKQASGNGKPQSSSQQEPTPAKVSFRIYADLPDSDKRRLSMIKRVKEFLEDLRSQSKKEESLDQIRRASIYLARAESLLDLLDKSDLPNREQANSETSASTQQEQEVLIAKSERIASEVGVAIQAIQDEIYRNWTVEIQAKELEKLAQDDLENAREAQYKSEQIRNNALRSIASSLLIAIACAFIIMVVADFMRAFLNLSNNSDLLVVNTNKDL
jgi:hypothetical protein